MNPLSTRRGAGLATGGVSALLAVGLVAGCGGSSGSNSASSATKVSASPTAPATASASASGRRGGGFFTQAELSQIQTCLKAAGITLPTTRPSGAFRSFNPSDRPSGFPSNRPTAFPSGSARPSGRFGGGAGGFGAIFTNPQAQQALKACGIALPSRPAGGNGGPGAPGGAPPSANT